MATTVQPRPALRKDAERNRRRLISAACEVIAEQGIGAPLEEIARRADVGIATLYRRFPTRSALIEALFEAQARECVRLSEVALEHEDAWESFAAFVEGICAMQAADRGFAEVLTASFPEASGLQGDLAQVRRNAEKLVARARRQGALREDFTAADLLWILVANAAYLRAMRGIAPHAWRRYIALILDAARGGDHGDLPPAPTRRQVDQAAERIGRRAAGE